MMCLDKKSQPLMQKDFSHLIPHKGTMMLIDQVDSWTDQYIYCRTQSHLLKSNPLRLANSLSVIHLIEYGAQCMAIHGGLLSGKSTPGYLAAVRNTRFYVDTLDLIKNTLHIEAKAELKIENGAVYSLRITDNDQMLLLETRATVINTPL